MSIWYKFHAPTSFDLVIFMSLIVLKYRIFSPFSAKMQDEDLNFSMLSPAKMGHFFPNSLFFRWSKHKYYILRVWWMFKFNGL